MATPRANEEVLKVILTKLHRLETAFNQINNRLTTIETSIVPATGSSPVASPFSSLHLASCCCASCVNSEPLQQSRHEENYKQHPAAEAYKCSVDKLHNQFRFGSGSEIGSVTHEEGTVYTYNNEDQSRADDHPVPDRQSRPASHRSPCQDNMKPVLGALKKPPLRHKNKACAGQMESPDLTRTSSIGSPTKVVSLLGTPKAHSTAAAPSGHPSPCWSVQSTRDDAFKNTKGSIRRARSMRYRKTNSSTAQRNVPLMGSANDTLDVDPTLIRRLEEKEFFRLYKIAQDSARTCIALGQRMMHVLHRGGG